jgi:hypothetical protein
MRATSPLSAVQWCSEGYDLDLVIPNLGGPGEVAAPLLVSLHVAGRAPSYWWMRPRIVSVCSPKYFTTRRFQVIALRAFPRYSLSAAIS